MRIEALRCLSSECAGDSVFLEAGTFYALGGKACLGGLAVGVSLDGPYSVSPRPSKPPLINFCQPCGQQYRALQSCSYTGRQASSGHS